MSFSVSLAKVCDTLDRGPGAGARVREMTRSFRPFGAQGCRSGAIGGPPSVRTSAPAARAYSPGPPLPMPSSVSAQVRLALVEDHHALRQGLELLLAHQGCEVVGTAGDRCAGLDLVRATE